MATNPKTLSSNILKAVAAWFAGGVILGVVEAVLKRATHQGFFIEDIVTALLTYTVFGILIGIILGTGLTLLHLLIKHWAEKINTVPFYVSTVTATLVSAHFYYFILQYCYEINQTYKLLIFLSSSLLILAITFWLFSRIDSTKRLSLCFIGISLYSSLLVLLTTNGLLPQLFSSRRILFQAMIILGCYGAFVLTYNLAVFLLKSSLFRKAALAVLVLSVITAFALAYYNRQSAVRKLGLKQAALMEQKPNIILIVMDTTRAGNLSCYGYNRKTTPNVDRIASEGVLFENAIAQAPWTLPSHASLFTGLYPSQHGVNIHYPMLDNSYLTLAEILDLAGYRTAAFSNNPGLHTINGLLQGFKECFLVWKKRAFFFETLTHNFFSSSKPHHTDTHRTIDLTEKWLSRHHNNKSPFFIFINFMDPHMKYNPPDNFKTLFLPDNFNDETIKNTSQDQMKYNAGALNDNETDFDVLTSLYDGEIAYLDFNMGRLFDLLRNEGILDNTILIITSDHGENIGDHELLSHALCVYDTLIHVPLIIRYPKLFPRGARMPEQVQLIDLYQTILHPLSIDPSEIGIESGGNSLVNPESNNYKSEFTISEYARQTPLIETLKKINPGFDLAAHDCELKTIRIKDYKYIWKSNGNNELYKISEDPEELNNLIGVNTKEAQKLELMLNSWLESINVIEKKSRATVLDEEAREKLKALGYLQ